MLHFLEAAFLLPSLLILPLCDEDNKSPKCQGCKCYSAPSAWCIPPGSVASIPKARKRQHYACPAQVPLDERSHKKLFASAVETFGRRG